MSNYRPKAELRLMFKKGKFRIEIIGKYSMKYLLTKKQTMWLLIDSFIIINKFRRRDKLIINDISKIYLPETIKCKGCGKNIIKINSNFGKCNRCNNIEREKQLKIEIPF